MDAVFYSPSLDKQFFMYRITGFLSFLLNVMGFRLFPISKNNFIYYNIVYTKEKR